ncbi:hypothetical protein ONZ45_g4927 [Pleurotus djamor]|nr:hypothetical protein ONZ45_g4927 [Pleurotus djamor]
MASISSSPPRAAPAKYATPLGTRWAKEKAQAGGSSAFDLPSDPSRIGPWILGECIGKGASGRVKLAKHVSTGQLAAVKILPIAPLRNSRHSMATAQAKQDKQRLGIDREITMMKLMDHPNIMRIYDVYEGERELFLVLEYVEGGELFDFLVNRGRLPPLEALIYFKQIIYGLNYAHTFSIIHRDLKPENILIQNLNPPLIKIADWGMAAFAPPSLQLETSCGSPHYASPEIVNGEKYEGNATDIWSCGVVLFALLTGRLPFDDKNVRTLLGKVRSGKFEIPAWIDPLARDLISRMLVVDVHKRITIPEILSHPWLVCPNPPASAMSLSVIARNPPLPPSPSTLATPLQSPEHVDPELLASLRIIWGRHADDQGLCIIQDLCSPPGEGTLAKAFYFLLGKHRDRVLAEHSQEDKEMHKFRKECESAFGPPSEGRQLAPGAARPPIKRASTVHATVSHTHTDGKHAQAPHGHVYAPIPRRAPAARNLLIPPAMARGSGSSASTSRSRPRSPAGPRQLHGVHSSTGVPSTARPISQHGEPIRPPSRPAGPRRGNTYSYHPRLAESAVVFPPRAQADPANDATPRIRSRSQTSAAYPVIDNTTARSVTPVVPPRSSNAELQQFMNDISQRVNDLTEQPKHTEHKRHQDKENQAPRADPSSDKVGKGHRGLGLSGKEISNVVESVTEVDGRQKAAGKAKRRPPTMDFSSQKTTDDCLASPILLSPPLSANEVACNRQSRARFSAYGPPKLSSVASPVVGEFKGWFSNLFNWKGNHHAGAADYFGSCGNGADVLYSPLDIVPTRVEVERYMEDELGVVIEGMSNKTGGISGQAQSRVQSSADQDSWRILKCKVEDVNPRSKSLGLKSVRFRVEFNTLRGRQRGPIPYGSSTRSSALLSPDLLATPKPVASASQSGHDLSFEASPLSPYLTAVVLVHEKGSSSSFKAIWRLLRERYPAQIKTSRTVGPGRDCMLVDDVSSKVMVY